MALTGDFYEYYDKRFYALTVPTADVEELFTGCRWAEGPVWFNDIGCLLWSDIPNNRMLRWIPDLGVGVYRSPANFTNGHTRDRMGRRLADRGEDVTAAVRGEDHSQLPVPGVAFASFADAGQHASL